MRAFFLVGQTAVGKTSVAQYIAEKDGYEILSADSMLVYKGMDIGTAKPDKEDRQRVVYHGLDLIEPTGFFNAGRYREYACRVIRSADARGVRILVVGGTGLYVKVLTDGLDKQWLKEPDYAPVAGIRTSTTELSVRILKRVNNMYEQGFETEVAGLVQKYGKLSATAEKAIGYSEALDILNGKCSRAEAIEKTARRTRQLAKRQMTWFRHQALVEWIDVDMNMRVEDIAQRVRSHWEKHGATQIKEI